MWLLVAYLLLSDLLNITDNNNNFNNNDINFNNNDNNKNLF